MQYVDSEILGKVIPRLSDLIKTGIGLGTKVWFSILLAANMLENLIRIRDVLDQMVEKPRLIQSIKIAKVNVGFR